MIELIWPAPAKINLMLHIIGQREDGYHELQTIFQFIDYADELVFTPRDDNQINRHSQNFEIPEEQDIIVRAARLLRERYQMTHPGQKTYGIDIQLTKNIPMGAGLGGGSSDAATTLIALNSIWQLSFSLDQLAEMGLMLGADVPVFVHGFAAFAEGIGEKLSPISLQEKWYLLLIPPVHVSTKEVFCKPDLTRDCSTIKLCDLSRREWRNVCTPIVEKNYPMVAQAIEIMSNYSKANMSGTGSSVFASFDTQAQAEEILQRIKENPQVGKWKSFVAKGLNRSPLHKILES